MMTPEQRRKLPHGKAHYDESEGLLTPAGRHAEMTPDNRLYQIWSWISNS